MAAQGNYSRASYNDAVDFWRYDIGVNVIPADTANKRPLVSWSEWQDKPIPEELFNQWKSNGEYSKGIAIIPGKIWHRKDKKDLYFIFIDTDKQEGIVELCTRRGETISLEIMAQKWVVEQHKDNPKKAHIYFYSPTPFPKKAADSVLGLEIKGLGEHGIAFCFPSIHRDGMPYEIIGTTQPEVLTDLQARELIQHIDQVCIKHGLQYLDKTATIRGDLRNIIRTLRINTKVKIVQGQRHTTLISVANSLLFNHLDRNKNSEDRLRYFFRQINFLLCEPEPLPDSEIDSIWKSALAFVSGIGKKQDEPDEEEHEDRQDNKDELDALQLVKENCSEFFLDQYGSPYTAIRINEHLETMSLQSRRFRNWLCKRYYDTTGELLNAEDLSGVLNILKAIAEFGGNIRELHLRVSHSNETDDADAIYYDLTNSNWETIKVTVENGWTIEKSSPLIFRRYTNQQAQVYPTRDYPADIFDQFMNLLNIRDEHNRLLLKCYIIGLFIPEVPKPILMLHGEQGSAKSTLQELVKMLIDPSIIRTLAFPKDNNELVQKLSHNFISYFDNVSDIRDWISDQLCRAVTGSGFSKRQLYTDDDDIIYNFKRCLGFNGINLGATKADLLDRGLIIQLERIAEEKRCKLQDIWRDFERIRPNLLGYIFDIIVKVLKRRREGSIKLESHPRMADFAEIAELISRCMGNKENEFLEVYQKNIGLQTEQALEASSVATAIIEFMGSKDKWLGTATELLEELEQVAESLKIKTKNNRVWPSAPNRLSRRLNEVKTNLRQVGIIIEKHKDTKTNTRKIEIRKVSHSSPASPEDEKQARLDPDYSGDNNTIRSDLSPAAEDNNHAHNLGFHDTYDTGDTVLASPLPIHRLGHSDTWGCKYCKQKGDKWFMQQHSCKGHLK